MGAIPDAAAPGESTVLGAIRRLNALAGNAYEDETVIGALARELMAVLGAQEVQVHHLARGGEPELVAAYLSGGDARLSYSHPRDERPPGVGWVASTGRSFLAVGPREMTASVPRLDASVTGQPGSVSCALLVPLAVAGAVEAVVVIVRSGREPFDETATEEAIALVEQGAGVLALMRARSEAGTDSVAGCMNHRAMRRRIAEEIGRAERSDGSLSCLIVDLDDFKMVNDHYGHQAGDAILRGVAQALMGEFRSFDRVARYGGDEFVVILPNADIRSAISAASRALARLHDVELPDGGHGVCASIGVAEWHRSMGIDDLLQVCDAALLQGKREGKGGVTGALAHVPADSSFVTS
jgi:diguanylate cyclase (GGDEF)-like protein